MTVDPFAGRTPEHQLANAFEASAESWQEVKRLGLVELLEQDSRPTVILDLNVINVERGVWGRVYTNPAYRSVPPEESLMRFNDHNGVLTYHGTAKLSDWAFGQCPTPDLTPITEERGWILTRITLRGRWRVLQGLKAPGKTQVLPKVEAASGPISIPRASLEQANPIPGASPGLSVPVSGTSPFLPTLVPRNASQSPSSAFVAPEMSRSVSGTRSRSSVQMNPVEDMHRHAILKGVDWTQSTLGAPEAWPRWMQQVVSTVLADPDPSIIFWADRAVIYNESVIPIISSKHPFATGRDAAVVFEEFWPLFEPLIDGVRKSHKCRTIDALTLPMDRRGYIEETHWKLVLLPLFNEVGECVGVLDRFSEITSSVIAARRLEQINLIGEKASEAASPNELWNIVAEMLAIHTDDTPYALLFSVEDEKGRVPSMEPGQRISHGVKCHLKSSVGIDKTMQTQLASFNLSDEGHFLARICASTMADAKLSILKTSDGSLPDQLQFAVPGRGHGDVCNAVLMAPITTAVDKTVAILVKALNPRRPIDADYLGFSRLIARRLQDSFSRVSLPTEERQYRAEVEQAAMEQSNLAQQLMMRTRQAEDEAAAFTKLAENAPIGMYMYSAQGYPIFINDYYFRMSGLTRETFSRFTWLEGVHADDRDVSMEWWHRLYNEKKPVTFEFRMAKPYTTTSKDGTEIATESWALASAFPQLDESEEVINIVGWQIDISAQKWAETLQKERLKDALESRAQAHRFIDMVSHECRNPLSAILQSADGILTSLSSMEAAASLEKETLQDAIETVQDSAQTIVLCAQHQKRIVDDILTVSKLDGNHLIITPDRANPVALIHHVLKMYEAEMDVDHIKSDVVILPGFKLLDVDYVLLDPSRTLQVLINLITNAVKFTAPSKKRQITVGIDASRKRPTTGPENTTFVPQRTARLSPNASHPDWATGRDLYITFSVTDTGRGMSAEEINKLFERFAQASPRTHIKYGGSGLGLFISRQLTELQGGQIGVSSRLGSGSTFAFYILARTSADPAKTAITPVYTPGPASDNSVQSHGNAYPFPKVSGQTASSTIVPGSSAQSALASQLPTSTPLVTVGPAIAQSRDSSSLADDNLHVLIVEDNIINQKVMAKQLRNLGCTVHVANHGVEALDFLRHSVFAVFPPCLWAESDHRLDVILMDIEMPVMDGISCVGEIRAMERRGELVGRVPVIAVTANARDAQQADALREGMDQVITKPFRIPELVPKMQALAMRRRTTTPPPPQVQEKAAVEGRKE